jgi:hypothetical protein
LDSLEQAFLHDGRLLPRQDLAPVPDLANKEQGDVLYIDLENGPRRIQSRIRTLFGHCESLPNLSRLEWVAEAPQPDRGFINRLELWRCSVKLPRLVVVDVLQRIESRMNVGGSTANQS